MPEVHRRGDDGIAALAAAVHRDGGDGADVQALGEQGVGARGNDGVAGHDAVQAGQVVDIAGGVSGGGSHAAAHDAVVAGALHHAGHRAAGIHDADDLGVVHARLVHATDQAVAVDHGHACAHAVGLAPVDGEGLEPLARLPGDHPGEYGVQGFIAALGVQLIFEPLVFPNSLLGAAQLQAQLLVLQGKGLVFRLQAVKVAPPVHKILHAVGGPGEHALDAAEQ